MKKLFLSTALPYVNSSPHIGFALEIIQADVVARYHRQKGEDVFFLTGTDENSLKNVQAAEKEGITVKELVDRNAKKFYELKNILNLSFDDFIRTTDERHIQGAQKLWRVCEKDIYKKKYKGLYCVGCEEFYREKELDNGLCPEHQTKPELIEEENYFFKLSKYQKEIKEIFENDKVQIIPATRKNEILSFINSGLQDICISRSNERAKNWGIDVPGDTSQKQWCWIEALSNYITALGYADDSDKFKKYWQKNDNILHIIGKGITRFHAVYWIGILLAAKIRLPKQIFVHGYITVNGQKMSKSIGNVINPVDLVEKYGIDPVRYFLLREISSTEDGDFTHKRFEERYNSDLASGLGNLVSRVLTMAKKSECGIKIVNEFQNPNAKHASEMAKKQYEESLNNFKFNEALGAIWQLISFCDKYIEQEKPWECKEEDDKVISDLLAELVVIAGLLQPFLPATAGNIVNQLKKGKSEALFPRL